MTWTGQDVAIVITAVFGGLTTLLSAVAAVYAAGAKRSAGAAHDTAAAIDQKTDAQNVAIAAIDKKADEAVDNTNGNTSKLLAQIDSLNQRFTETIKEHQRQLVDVITKPAPTPTIVVTPVTVPPESAPGGRRHDDGKKP